MTSVRVAELVKLCPFRENCVRRPNVRVRCSVGERSVRRQNIRRPRPLRSHVRERCVRRLNVRVRRPRSQTERSVRRQNIREHCVRRPNAAFADRTFANTAFAVRELELTRSCILFIVLLVILSTCMRWYLVLYHP